MNKKQDETIVGLTDEEVIASREKYGANTLTRQKRKGFFRQYLSAFGDPIIKILLAVLALNLIFLIGTSDWTETVGIAVAVFLSTLVSTLSQYGSESAFLELQKAQENVFCRVKRGKEILSLLVSELVVGDVLLLSAGEKVPADGTVLSGKVSVDQSALNGESAEVEKSPCASGAMPASLADKQRLFTGSTVISGECIVRVDKVGDNTFYGQMARETQEEPPESPLRVKLNHLAKSLSKFGYIAAVLVAIADLFNAFFIDNGMVFSLAFADLCDWKIVLPRLMHALTLAIAVVVVAVPEGLPMMIAVVLSSNMLKMSKDNVLVRKAVGIEAAGGMNILFTDKTGTLTKGALEAVQYIEGGGQVRDEITDCSPAVRAFLTLSATYNTGSVLTNGKPVGGNATDRALFMSALPLIKKEPNNYERISILPFDSVNKFSAAYLKSKEKEYFSLFGSKCALVKGAPEKLLPACENYLNENGSLSPFFRADMEKKIRLLTRRAMRVIAVAVTKTEVRDEKDLKGLVFVGLIALRDDIREEVPAAIEEVMGAGVQVVMITGDNIETAKAVAREAGLFRETGRAGMRSASSADDYVCLTGTEMSRLSDGKLEKLLPKLRVVARALPTDKSRLVRVAQSQGLVTGMTGDGINDSPALKKSDVGFSMGSGTEVAKEAGDIVITDDNFASIAKAIRYGRTIFKSIRKFVVFQLTMNLCAVGVSLIAPFIGIDTPVTVIQMLWINVIMDTVAGLAFSGEPALKEYMKEAPVRRDEKVLGRSQGKRIVFIGVYTILLCLFFLKSPAVRTFFDYEKDPMPFYAAFFTLFVFSGVFNTFNARSERVKIFAHLKKNKIFIFFILLVAIIQLILVYFGGSTFRCAPLSLSQLLFVAGLALSVIPMDILRKIVLRSVRKTKARRNKALILQNADRTA